MVRVSSLTVLLFTLATAGGVAHPKTQQIKTATIAGTVRTQDGKTHAGVLVKILTLRSDGGRDYQVHNKNLPEAKTDREGKYKLTLRFSGEGNPVLGVLAAELKGYVRAEPAPELVLKDGQTATVDITMRPGKVLAGTINVSPTVSQLEIGAKPDEQDWWFSVKGPSFGQLHRAAKNGSFEVYVPPGAYSIRCLFHPKSPEWKDLKSGSRDLRLTVPFAYTEEYLGPQFDRLWEVMDRHYSYFAYKKGVDWKVLKERYRPQAVKAKNRQEFIQALKHLLAPLRDMHVWIQTPEGYIATFSNPYRGNRNRAVTLALLEERTNCGFARVGKTKDDGFGYFLMVNQSRADAAGVRKAIEAIRRLHDAPGFIVDLRTANGGDEDKAADVARLFCGKDTVYARSKWRDGPAHDKFGEVYERVLKASEQPYTKPVVCLIGPGAISSGEGFVQMMKCLPNVTTVGMRTRGASGNPQPWDLYPMGVAVWFSRWVDLMPDGSVFEGVGIAPDVTVDVPPEDYAKRDPTLEKGLEVLRRKVEARNRTR